MYKYELETVCCQATFHQATHEEATYIRATFDQATYEQVLLDLLNYITNIIDNGNCVNVITANYVKAFDSVSRNKLIYKLQFYNIRS